MSTITNKEQRKLVNLFRFLSRIEVSCTETQLISLISLFTETSYLLNPAQKSQIENSLANLRLKLSKKDDFVTERRQLVSKPIGSQTLDDLERANLERELLVMAKEMKSAAMGFKESMLKDNATLHNISTKQFKHLSNLKKQTTILSQIQVKTSLWATIRSLFAVVVSFFIFLFMLFFIRTFPDKQYIPFPTN